MKKLFLGPTGSGKTSRLLELYTKIGEKHNTAQALVLVNNARDVNFWRQKINLDIMGPLNIYTLFGFLQKEIKQYWPIIEAELPGGPSTIEPIFMNVETAHFLMTKFVEKFRIQKDSFADLKATSSQIAVQLLDNLNHGAMNALNLAEINERLRQWAISEAKEILIQDAIQIMGNFRSFCLQHRLLDYSLLATLFQQHLMREEYLKDLAKRFPFILVDDLEKMLPLGQYLILKLMARVKDVYLSYNPEAGFNRFFGGNPDLAQKLFFPRCEKEWLKKSYTSSPGARKLAREMARSILEEKNISVFDFIKGEIACELRGEMILETAQQVFLLLKQGVKAGEIALIAPQIDKVLEFTLEHYFKKKGYKLLNLTGSKRLVDIPFAQALITLYLLLNPHWGIEPGFTAIQQTMALVLKMDPVRSALLAREIVSQGNSFFPLEESRLRGRIGLAAAARYDFLQEWLQGKKEEGIEMEEFFQVVFGELLAPLKPDRNEIMACRQLIASINKFKQAVSRFKEFKEDELGKYYLEMIFNGTLAADVLFAEELEDSLILATPYKFLFNPALEKVKYLFFFDISSELWLRSIGKELTNPFIFSPQWKNYPKWDEEKEELLRKKQLTDFLQSILSKATEGLYLTDSFLNNLGWEQEGPLANWLRGEVL